MSENYCDIGNCPNKFTRSRRGQDVCEIHYAEQNGYTKPRVNPDKIEECEICGYKSLNKRGRSQRLITHHVSYNPEKTVEVCDRCHQKIHNGDLPEYQPSERQLWFAEETLRKQDFEVLEAVGRVEFTYRKSDEIKRGRFVVNQFGLLGFISCDKSDPVWLFKEDIYRCDINFLDSKPWKEVRS